MKILRYLVSGFFLLAILACQAPTNIIAPHSAQEESVVSPNIGGRNDQGTGFFDLILDASEGTQNSVSARLLGKVEGVISVEVHDGSPCQNRVGHFSLNPSTKYVNGILSSLNEVGPYHFYLKLRGENHESDCIASNANYLHRTAAPTGVTVDLVSSSDSTPEVVVSGVAPGYSVMIYGDANCSILRGVGFASSNSVSITSHPLSAGRNLFYARSEKNGISSTCSTAYAAYQFSETSRGGSITVPPVPISLSFHLLRNRGDADYVDFTISGYGSGVRVLQVFENDTCSNLRGNYAVGLVATSARIFNLQEGDNQFYLKLLSPGGTSACVSTGANYTRSAKVVPVPSSQPVLTLSSANGFEGTVEATVSGYNRGVHTIKLFKDQRCRVLHSSHFVRETTFSYTFTGLSVGRHHFSAIATNGGGDSPCSEAVSHVQVDPPVNTPVPPTPSPPATAQPAVELWSDYSYIILEGVPASDGQYKFGNFTNGVYTAASSWESIKNANVLGLYQNSSDGSDNLNLFLGVPSNGIIVYELSSTQWVAFNVNSVHSGNTNDRGVFSISRHSYNDGSAIDSSRVHDPARFGLSWNQEVVLSPPTAGICDRTAEVQSVLLLSSTKNCSQVTAEDLLLKSSIGLTRLTSLKEGDFAGLSNLSTIFIDSSQLSSLPERVFAGLSSLRSLSLGTLGSNQISTLSYSNMLKSLSETTTRNNGTVSAIGLKYNASAAAARQSLVDGDWTITDLGLEGSPPPSTLAGVCNRTTGVRDAIVAAVAKESCSQVTAENLRSISSLTLDKVVTSLEEGDFAGLSSLQMLYIINNPLRALPEGIFAGLSSLQKLIIYGDNLKIETLPEGILAGLSSLQWFTFKSRLLNALPEGIFAGLSSLQNLIIGGGHSKDQMIVGNLKTLPAGIFAGLSSLERLSISRTRLVTFPEGIFDGLSSLRQISLFSNRSTSYPEGMFSGLSSLQIILISTSGTRTLPEGIFAGLSQLQKIYLGYGSLKTLPEGIFAGLSSLQQIRFYATLMETLPEGIFAGLSSLESLVFTESNITSLPEGVFAGLSSLQTIALGKSKLTSLPAGIFDGLSSLEGLYLWENRLTSLPAGIFAGLSSLESLYLNNNRLTSLPEGIFAGLSSLERLSLGYNPLSSLGYGKVLIDISNTTTKNNGEISASTLKYNASAAAARQSLINRGWTIQDKGR